MPAQSTAVVPVPRPEVRDAVRNLLTKSEAYRKLSPEQQRSVAQSTALIADYLVAPENIPGNQIAGGLGMPTGRALAEGDPAAMAPPQQSYKEARKAVTEIGDDKFSADAAHEGAAVAKEFMKAVSFPAFVSGLIEGVFSSIVRSSIQQMEAYQKMIASVAQSLQQFRDDNVSPNQGRDHMAEKFPDLFEIGTDDMAENPQPRLRLREGVDENDALKRVNSQLSFTDGQLKSMDLSDENTELAIITAARTQLARQRQQLMASLVLMGINRIVVTDGKLSAKIMYDFQAKDNRRLQRSASAFDYARNPDGSLSSMWKGEGEYDSGSTSNRTRSHDADSSSSDSSADSYAKGTYKYEQNPVMTAMSTASDASETQLQTRAQLTGAVEVNFKSDYLPLDKMATPGMIAAIQGNSTPVDPNVVPSAVNRPTQAAADAAVPAAH
ncbi:MAG: hypothetical protein V4484_22680 [Pseudomonadota bacterium]